MWKKLSNSEKVDSLPNEKGKLYVKYILCVIVLKIIQFSTGESNLNEIFNKQINIAQKQTIEKKGKSKKIYINFFLQIQRT